MPTYQYFSRMTQILNVKLGGIFNETKHILVLGGSGSGKTSALLLFCYLLKQNDETILWRDDSSTEWLSLVNEFPWRCFVPQNCEFSYKHENIEYIPYDPWDLKTLFKEVKRGQAHAIEFDPYTMDIAIFVDFWSRFFFDLYKWKGPDIRSKVAFFTDELNDLAAGARRGFVPRQLQLASRIYLSLKKYRKERIRLVACYDTQTRVLTQEGLKDHETLKIGAMGLSIDLQTKEIEWKPIVNIRKYPYIGKMVHFKGKSFDVLVTPNHKMLLSTGQRTGWQNLHFEEASRASKRSMFRFPQGMWTVQKFPDLTNDFFYLLGLYIGDGYTYSKIKDSTKSGLRREEYLAIRDGCGRFCQHGSPAVLNYHRPRVYLCIPPEDKSRKKVEDALARLNIKWNNDYYKMLYFDTASSKRFEDVFSECGPYADEKHIPRKWLDGASAEQLKSLFDGLINSDGNNASSYKTVSEQLAVDFIELVTKLGWSGTIKTVPGKRCFIKDRVAQAKQYYVISVHFRPKYKPFENVSQEEDYSGVVWCPEVADNHNLLVERNGRFVFCGNSSHGYGDLHKPVREGFNYYIFKRMDPGSIPDQFRRYDKVIERLDLNEMFIVDENKSFNKMEIEECVKPRRVSVRWKGSVAPTSVKKADELAQWKSKIVTLVTVLHDVYEVPYKMIAPALGYSEQSGLNNLMKKYSTKEIASQIETLSKQVRQLEQEQAAE